MKRTSRAAKKTDAPVPNWPKDSQRWPLAKIKPYPKNPRTHPPDQIKLLAEMLLRWGPDQPIVVDEKGVILKGHGRFDAAKLAAFEEFPVVQRFGLTETEKQAIRIADNQVALLSGWDSELLRMEVGELKLKSFDLALLGFGEIKLAEIIAGGPNAPGQFAAFGEDIDTQHECPRCHYKWSGKSAPPTPPEKDGKE